MVGCAKDDAKKIIKLMLVKNEVGGKTTILAQKIFDKVTKSGQFQQKIWICVSKVFKVVDLLKEIIRLADGNCGQGESRNELANVLEETEGQKVLRCT